MIAFLVVIGLFFVFLLWLAIDDSIFWAIVAFLLVGTLICACLFFIWAAIVWLICWGFALAFSWKVVVALTAVTILLYLLF